MSELDDIRKRTEGHTEGPWEFDEDNVGSCYGRAYYGIITPSVYTTFGIRAAVAAEDYSPRGCGAREEECKSNAQLIAAAPDLLRIATEQEAELIQLRTKRDEAIAEAEKLAEAVEEIANCMGPEALPAVNDMAMMAHVALDAYRNRPQVSQDANTYIKQRTIRDTVLQEKDTRFACNWEYGPHREPMRPEWKSGCGKIYPKMLSEEWHDLCPYCGKPVHVPDALEET